MRLLLQAGLTYCNDEACKVGKDLSSFVECIAVEKYELMAIMMRFFELIIIWGDDEVGELGRSGNI